MIKINHNSQPHYQKPIAFHFLSTTTTTIAFSHPSTRSILTHIHLRPLMFSLRLCFEIVYCFGIHYPRKNLHRFLKPVQKKNQILSLIELNQKLKQKLTTLTHFIYKTTSRHASPSFKTTPPPPHQQQQPTNENNSFAAMDTMLTDSWWQIENGQKLLKFKSAIIIFVMRIKCLHA